VVIHREKSASCHPEMLCEFFGEFLMFLIAPCLAERIHLPRQNREFGLQIAIEITKHPSKPAEIFRVNNRLGHAASFFG
jgi:hypothetical protein